MRCSEFRAQHCAYVDDTLAGVELVRMQRHVNECPECSAHDAKVRRSLLLVRNMRPVEPSPDFTERLEARLMDYRLNPDIGTCTNFRAVATVGALASLLMVGYIAQTLHTTGRSTDIVLPPVVAMAEPPASLQISPMDFAPALPTAPAILASVSAGMPLWPAAMFAEQAPLHYANPQRH